MIKKTKKLSKVTGTKPIVMGEVTGTVNNNLEKSTSVCKNKISKLELDLGRGDLNLLRDKLNEVIEQSWQ
jgi:hypothetical protein